MKKIFLLYTLLLTSFCFSQLKGTISIDWSDKSDYYIGEDKYSIPLFSPENLIFESYTNELFFVKKIKLTQLVDEKSLQITNVVFENINENELGNLDRNKIQSQILTKFNASSARNEVIARLQITPIIKENGLYKKIKSFDYSFNYSNIVNRNINMITSSILSSGNWYRFYVEKSGVYRVSKSFLKSLGMNVDNIDPKKIKIFGNGGRMVPLLNSTPYPDDLTENAIEVTGVDDGVFNDNDAIIFYAEGVDNWSVENKTNGNLYSDKSYYYVTSSGTDGKRITEATQPTGVSTQTITEIDKYSFHEVDLVNIIKLGRTWFGEDFDTNNSQSFPFTLSGLVPNSQVTADFHLATMSQGSSSFKIEANGQLLTTQSFTSFNSGKLPQDRNYSATFESGENLSIKLTFNNNGIPTANGFLDYINIKYKSFLQGTSSQYRFQSNASANNNIKEYLISNAVSISEVWDISDIFNVTKYTNPNSNTFSFKTNTSQIKQYTTVVNSNFFTPLKDSQSQVANQDLKGTIFNNANGAFQDIDYIIITPGQFYNQAERLANFHRNYSLLNTKVITLESIYPEFSSGKQDVGAIRNLIKYVYNNASSPEKKIKYINLFGDASFDMKNRISNNTNFVPIYHALNSYVISESSFACDDFYGLMDNNEGFMDGIRGEIDIAVGRMIADSSQQADDLVNKVIEYHDEKSYGKWRNNFVAIADDSDASSDCTLQTRINNLVNTVVAQKPFINPRKILLDAYSQETSAGGNRYPQARTDIFNAFENGALVFNYLGHGGEDGLAQERIWEKNDGINLNNRYKYPLFVTITCDFSRYDNPTRPTAGEYVYLNPRGGAISMITTVREIGQGTGEAFNTPLAKYLFEFDNNQSVSIAEALRLSKNDFGGYTSIIAYLGDPALMLALPKPKVKLTKVNDVVITQPFDNFKALSLMKINGEITDENDVFLSTYNGDVAIEIFDKNIARVTLNNDFNCSPLSFTIPGETIFRGNATVVNGQFEFSFVVPRDITIATGNGKMSFYAKRNNVRLDKTGYDTSIVIGGVNLNAPVDTTPPTVKLYMNDKTFVSGGITNESPIFLAYLEDENGINTASGIGHDIIAILDGDETNPYKLNDYYETELDNYKKGNVKFPFRNLALGLHTISFRAWDVYNNPINAEIQFIVVGNESVTLTNVLNYPNPFVNYTQFWFTHNRPFEPLDVQVQIMTITGKVIWTKNQIVNTEGFLSKDITWDGKDDFGDKIGKGVYVYKLTVKSSLSNSKTEKYEKLVIL